MQIKAELRKQLLISRSRISENIRRELSEKIAERLFAVREFREAGSVFCYISKENEIFTEKIVSRCLSEEKLVAAPVCVENEMIFRYITGNEDLKKGNFSVLEPKSHCPEAKAAPDTVCITPALCFNPQGYRIGYGKGFYDRYFAKNECVKIGLCFDEYIRNFNPDVRDEAVDIIVTESKVIRLPLL